MNLLRLSKKAESYSSPEERLDTAVMANALIDKGCSAQHFPSNQAVLNQLKETIAQDPGGLIVFFTNGSFDGIQHSLCENFELGCDSA